MISLARLYNAKFVITLTQRQRNVLIIFINSHLLHTHYSHIYVSTFATIMTHVLVISGMSRYIVHCWKIVPQPCVIVNIFVVSVLLFTTEISHSLYLISQMLCSRCHCWHMSGKFVSSSTVIMRKIIANGLIHLATQLLSNCFAHYYSYIMFKICCYVYNMMYIHITV